MAENELHAFAYELVGDRHALLRIRHVVAESQFDLHAEHAAGCVEVSGCHFGTLLELSAESGVRAGERAGNADLQRFGLRRTCREDASREGSTLEPVILHAVFLPSAVFHGPFLRAPSAGNLALGGNLARFQAFVTRFSRKEFSPVIGGRAK